MRWSRRATREGVEQMERTKTQQAFTLIEMLIVIVVISILIGVLLPGFRGAQDEAAEQRAALRRKGRVAAAQRARSQWTTCFECEQQ